MNAHVHTLVATTTLFAGVQPNTPGEVLTCAGVAAIAGVISDIDSEKSKASQEFRRVVTYLSLGVIGLGVAMIGFGYNPFSTELISSLSSNFNIIMKILAMLVFFGLTAYASTRPHREFAHSVYYSIPLAVSVWVLFDFKMGLLFFIAQMSHNLIDTINKKPVHICDLLFPEGVYFNLITADGIIAKWLGIVCSAYCVYYLDSVNFTVKIVKSIPSVLTMFIG